MVWAGELYVKFPRGPAFTLIQAGASCEWTSDSQRLILENFDAIHDSPSQLYRFALPFCPSSSWLRENYKAEFLQEVNVVVGLPAKWGACSRTVDFDQTPLALACHRDIIAVGLQIGDIVILDAITGTSTSTLPGHTDLVRSLAFSLDGAQLASGSSDKTIRLWDIQTGGDAETFRGHSSGVLSVSISPDSVMIASGSEDKTIRLWDTQTGSCHRIIDHHQDIVTCVDFSPTNSQRLISASLDGTVRQWSVDGCQTGPPHSGYLVAYSPPDGARFFSYTGSKEAATFRQSDSGEITTELRVADGDFCCFCFSPDGKFVASATGRTVYVWDITGLNPYLVGTFVGHAGDVISLTYSSSSLISASDDKTVKFWQIVASPIGPVTTDTEPMQFAPTSIKVESLSLHAIDNIVISSDSRGVVKKWDISTGLCMASFQTPAKGKERRDAQLISGRLVVVWYAVDSDNVGKIRIAGAARIRLPGGGKIHIWDAEREECIRTVDAPERESMDLRISGDGSKVFCLGGGSIRAWSIETGVATGGVGLKGQPLSGSLTVDGSRVWVRLNDFSVQGWDFEISDSPPIPLSDEPPSRHRLVFIDGTREWNTGPSRIEDTSTGKEVFRLSGRYARPDRTLWDGRYLVAGYHSGEVMVMDLGKFIVRKLADNTHDTHVTLKPF
jgi:WD40 repeat protein